MCATLFPTVMTHGSAVSPLYHFTLSDGTPLSAQTRCKFCCPPNPDVQPFIMGFHTIDRYRISHCDCDCLCFSGLADLSMHVKVEFPFVFPGNTTLQALRKTLSPAFHRPLAALAKPHLALLLFLLAATGHKAQVSPPWALTLIAVTGPPRGRTHPHPPAT